MSKLPSMFELMASRPSVAPGYVARTGASPGPASVAARRIARATVRLRFIGWALSTPEGPDDERRLRAVHSEGARRASGGSIWRLANAIRQATSPRLGLFGS